MHRYPRLILMFGSLCLSLLAVDQSAVIHATGNLAEAAAFRGVRTVLAGIDEDRRIEAGTLERARQQAALTMLPVTPRHGPVGAADSAMASAADRLASARGLDFAGLSRASGRTFIVVTADGHPLKDGSTVDADAVLEVRVRFVTTLRADPAALIFRDAGEGLEDVAPARTVRGWARVVVGGHS